MPGVKASYSQQELDSIAAAVAPRSGWGFSRMVDWRADVPWDYSTVVIEHLADDSRVLDIGAGGGERLLSFASRFGSGLGIDLDPAMVAVAAENGCDKPKVS